jgi:hypothetical protein
MIYSFLEVEFSVAICPALAGEKSLCILKNAIEPHPISESL